MKLPFQSVWTEKFDGGGGLTFFSVITFEVYLLQIVKALPIFAGII